VKGQKRRELPICARDEAVDFIRVFVSFAFANYPEKRLKYGYLIRKCFTLFFLPEQAPTQAQYLFNRVTVRGGLYWKGW